MNNIISQNFKKMLKNKIKTIISPILYDTVDLMVENIFVNKHENKYINLFLNVQTSLNDLIRKTIVTTFKEIDDDFRNSPERTSRYFVNKSNVSRTLTTIVGTITFSRTYYYNKFSHKNFFYIDDIFDLPKYDHYDHIVKGIAIDKAVHTSQAQSSYDVSAYINNISYYTNYSCINNIPRQSIYNWIKAWNTPDIIPESIDTPDTLYVMADEKYIGAQDIKKDIMVKCFVTFEGVKNTTKNRRELINRSVFSCYDSNAWPKFMDFIAKRYDFSKIKNIALLGDGGTWIKTGLSELKLDHNNHVKFYLCEFHFKQAIHHIIKDKEQRSNLLDIFENKPKKEFTKAVNLIIDDNPNRKETIEKKRNYIINNYSAIKNMLELKIGSSMESHISHFIASYFASRPKGFLLKELNNI